VLPKLGQDGEKVSLLPCVRFSLCDCRYVCETACTKIAVLLYGFSSLRPTAGGTHNAIQSHSCCPDFLLFCYFVNVYSTRFVHSSGHSDGTLVLSCYVCSLFLKTQQQCNCSLRTRTAVPPLSCIPVYVEERGGATAL